MNRFKKAVSALVLTGSIFAGSSSAIASHSYTYQGLVSVFKGIPLVCTITVVKVPDHAIDPVTGLPTGPELNTGTVTVNVSPPIDPACAIVNVTSNPMRYTQGAAGIDGWKDMVVENFYVETITAGDCAAATVTIRKRQIPGTSQWEMDVTSTIPQASFGGPCIITGVIPKV